MRITAPRTQDERLVPLLDTPPKWLPGIDVGIQTHFLLKFVFVFFNWNILLIFLSSAFKFLLKGLVSAALCFLAGFLLFWGGNGVVRMLCGLVLMSFTPTIWTGQDW